MKKTWKAMLPIVLTIGIAAGCGGAGDGQAGVAQTDKSGKTAAENVELTWWVDAREDVQQTYQEIKAEFENKNPNVKINMVKTSDDKINERISIAVNTNQMPDVQQGSVFWPLTYAQKDLLAPVDDLIDKADFDDSALKSVQVNGKTYIYPNSTAAIGLLVNKDMFKEKGAVDLLPKNMGPWTTEQFKKAAKAVTDPAKQTYGFMLFAGNTAGDQMHHALLWGFGAKSWSDDGKKSLLNSPEGVEGLQFEISLIDEGLVLPGAAGLTPDMNLFAQGKVGMMVGSIGNVPAVTKAFDGGAGKKFEIDLIPYPSKDGKKSNTVLFGYGTWIWNTKNAKKMEWSKKFVQFVNSKNNMAKMAKAESVVTTRKSLASDYPDGSLQKKTTQLFQYAGNIGLGVPGYSETRNAFYPELQAAYTKKKTAQQALDDYVKKANEIIANASK
ncbi:extracellular solute-binding protein [Paenibacillus mesophilus]|uniref:extracellular solute-binding protein n=1 Tax=Paenibacillus mesophilus TaxID=2582849 RepID=UPI00110F3C69|nr:extracellular solute-binding protein [Paenibacillus mesophilus]TMV51518.1 extracellular solute-binding protein [Paenibacillus mesophilus]